ncbi:MAG: HAMP domain-containing sensor histidine kinase [Bryobacteraceae bacterium]|nr:HAMP domain-containing sensor histidine kinase [Bryobacteraceae bacterium]
MLRARARQFLFDSRVEHDPGFRAEIVRLSLLAMRVGGCVSIGLSWFFFLSRFVVSPEPRTVGIRALEVGAFTLLGLLSLLAPRWDWVRRRARATAIGTVILADVIAVGFTLRLQASHETRVDDYIPAQVTVLMLICVASIPLRPMQTGLVGAAFVAVYLLFGTAGAAVLPLVTVKPAHVLFMSTLTMLSVAITAVVYQQRVEGHRSHQEALAAVEDLRKAEARMLLSENAALLGRLSAALSHELNSPIGALLSAVDTLLLLSSRQAVAPADDQGRLVLLQGDIRKTIRTSVERLRSTAARMQRFTNLDRAEVQEANINGLLEDVAALIAPAARERGTLELQLEDVPPLICRPQQISAVFHNLLSNALQAVDGDGRVTVRTRVRNRTLEVEVHDNGVGLSKDEVDRLFDPAFRETGGIVSTGNWGMFGARQIVRQHDGEITIESGRGSGTKVLVTLPYKRIAAASAAAHRDAVGEPERLARG